MPTIARLRCSGPLRFDAIVPSVSHKIYGARVKMKMHVTVYWVWAIRKAPRLTVHASGERNEG